MTPSVYIPLASIIVASIGVFGGWLVSRRPDAISGAKEITESALLLVEPQSQRIAELVMAVNQMSMQVDGLTSKIMRLERHVDVLTNQIVSMGATPVPLEEVDYGID